jgi:hypothetical protein
MVQIRWGRAGLVRLPVIPSPSWRGHGAVRWQPAGSIKWATTPSGGQTNWRAEHGVRGHHGGG